MPEIKNPVCLALKSMLQQPQLPLSNDLAGAGVGVASAAVAVVQ